MSSRIAAWLGFAAALMGAGGRAALADGGAPAPGPMPAVSAAPSPLPSKSPKRFSLSAAGAVDAIDQQFTGPGIRPPEGPGFVGGGIVAPSTPYDLYGNSPLTTGLGYGAAVRVTPVFRLTPFVDLSADVGFGSLGGSGNVAAYWGSQPLPQLNPHLGMRAVTVPPAFTTHNAQDPITGNVVGITGGSIASRDGSAVLRGGWFDLNQSQTFVFAPPPATSTAAALAPVLPESIGDGPPASSGFGVLQPALPLHGVDLTLTRNVATLEATDADLPSPPQTPARLRALSLTIDRGNGRSYGFEVIHATTGGAPAATTILFGDANGVNGTLPSSQGLLPFSQIGGQRNTIAGISANVPFGARDAAAVKIGYSRYAADGTFAAGSASTGGFYYGKVKHAFGPLSLALEGVRFDATYAPEQIAYGTLENIWSVAYSWPGTWLKGNYPLADVSMVGPNRQGARVSGAAVVHGVDVRLAYAEYAQIRLYDATNAYRPGFVEGYFLPQLGGGATLGREQHAAASFAWHPRFAAVALDLTDITLARKGARGNPADAVAMDYPAGVFTLSRQLAPRLFAAAGAARYAVDGSFANSGPHNADLAQNVVFGGVQYSNDGRATLHVQYRLYSAAGTATLPGGPLPAFHGPQLLVEQRFVL